MATIDQAIYDRITADSDLSGSVGTRIFPTTIPETTATGETVELPAIAYHRISGRPDSHHTQDADQAENVFQFDVVAENQLDARTIAGYLKASFHQYRGTVSGVVIHSAHFVRDVDEYGRVGQNYQASIDINIRYTES